METSATLPASVAGVPTRAAGRWTSADVHQAVPVLRSTVPQVLLLTVAGPLTTSALGTAVVPTGLLVAVAGTLAAVVTAAAALTPAAGAALGVRRQQGDVIGAQDAENLAHRL